MPEASDATTAAETGELVSACGLILVGQGSSPTWHKFFWGLKQRKDRQKTEMTYETDQMTKISGETILPLILDRDNSASHLHANSLISENSIGSHVSSPSIVAYNVVFT